MQVALYQSIYGDVICQLREVDEEIKKEYLPTIKKIIEDKYPVYSDYEILEAYYIASEYKIVVQLYNKKINSYVVIEI